MTFLRHATTMLCVLLLLVFAWTSFSFSQAEGDTPYSGKSPVIRSSSNLHNPNRPNDAIVVVLPGNGSTSGNGRAPQGSRLFINTKYLITGAEMTASGFGANQVSSIGWRWNVPRPQGAGAPVAQSVATTGNLKVFLKDTTSDAAGLIGTFIDTNGVGYTKVIDATISITRTDTLEFTVDVAAGGPGTSPFTPTPGSGLLVIFVYQTTTPLATPVGAPTVFCTNLGSLLTYQSQTVNGTTGTASTFRPETRFGSAAQTCSQLSSQWAVGQYPNLPAATYFQASDWLGDTLFVQAPTTAGAGSTTIYRYTLGGPWTTGTPLPAAKVGGSLTKCGSKLYYIGGGTAGITTGTTDVYEYDPATGAWTTKAPLPVALSAHGAMCWGDSVIFVIGGPYTGSATNLNVYYYRPASDTWGTIVNSLPANQGRRTFGHGISGDKIIISAGYNVAFLKSTYIGTIGSDASQITWTAAPDVPTIYTGLSRPGGAAYGDYFYLVCGERAGAGGYYDTTHVLKISTGAWTYIVNNKPVDMSNIFNGVTARCVADTVRVFVPGGYGGAASDVFDVIGAGPSLLTDVKIDGNEIPTSFTLEQNYPNPFNPSTTIQFQLPTSAEVTLRIFSVLGQEVATLVSGQRTAGTYQVLWDGRASSGAPVASGVYFYSLAAKGQNGGGPHTILKKMLFLK